MLQKEWGQIRGSRIAGLLDVGTSKIVCLIVALPKSSRAGSPFDQARVLGVGHKGSRGVKAGVIVDLDEAEHAVRATIADAERMAGVELEEIYVSAACGRMRSRNFTAKARIEGAVVTSQDVTKLLTAGRRHAEQQARTLIHMNHVGFRLDGTPGLGDPRGMVANELAVDLHAVTADDAPIRNLIHVVERCYLSVAGLVAAPYASALSVTSDEDRRLGVTVIDIGGGTTTLSIFAEGQFVYTDAVPVGGNHISFDIARALNTPLAEAERIKALYGTLVGAQSDEHELISYSLAGDEEGGTYRTTKAQLAEIIRPRVNSMLALVGERIERGGFAAYAGDCVVLTGGGSELVGMAEYASVITGRKARVSRPLALLALPPGFGNPAFATVIGLIAAGAARGSEGGAFEERDVTAQSYLGRVSQWLKSGF
jgi:cell division protein FtsA